MTPTLIRREMSYWLMKPDPRLRSRVFCYFLAVPIAAADWDPAAAYKDEEMLIPDGHSEIVFNLGGAYERWVAGSGPQRAIMRRSYLIGGRSQSVLTRDLDRVTVAGVKLDPRLLHELIKTPLIEFSDETLTLADLNDGSLLDLEDAVAAAAHCPQAVAAVLDRFFLKALSNVSLRHGRIDALLKHIHAHHGMLSIMDWIRSHGIGPRYIERRFSAMMGMTPKRYARVIRFKHSYHALVSGKLRADDAHLDGYYDRSHFNKEFKSFVGAPPSSRTSAALPQGTSISDVLLESELASR